jgi:hypothetical protein
LKRAARLCSMPVNRYRGVAKVLLSEDKSIEELMPRSSHAIGKSAEYQSSKSRPRFAAYSYSNNASLSNFVPADDVDSSDEGVADTSTFTATTNDKKGGLHCIASESSVTIEGASAVSSASASLGSASAVSSNRKRSRSVETEKV